MSLPDGWDIVQYGRYWTIWSAPDRIVRRYGQPWAWRSRDEAEAAICVVPSIDMWEAIGKMPATVDVDSKELSVIGRQDDGDRVCYIAVDWGIR